MVVVVVVVVVLLTRLDYVRLSCGTCMNEPDHQGHDPSSPAHRCSKAPKTTNDSRREETKATPNAIMRETKVHHDEPCKGSSLLSICRTLDQHEGVIHQLAIETSIRGVAERTVARTRPLQ